MPIDAGARGLAKYANSAAGISAAGGAIVFSSGVPVSVTNTTSQQMLDYCIVPRAVLGKNSRIHIRTMWEVAAASGNATLNVGMNEAGYTPPGNGGGGVYLFSGNAAAGQTLIESTVQFRNSLYAQASMFLGNKGASGSPGAGNVTLSTFDFESHDIEFTFLANNPTASTSYWTTLIGWSVEVFG